MKKTKFRKRAAKILCNILKYLGYGSFFLILSIIISAIVIALLNTDAQSFSAASFFGKVLEALNPASENNAFALNILDGVVAAVAAGFLLLQLKAESNVEEKQARIDKSQFILEFNRSFIENDNMTEIEKYLESALTGSPTTIASLSENRQALVNYLVYLEGFSACILDGILDLDDIDDLFAYRFFLAMNHPEVQSLELCPFAAYYRGCFQLYEKWLNHRITSDKYSNSDTKNWDIPLYETALCFWQDYEAFALSDVTVKTENNEVTVFRSSKKIASFADNNVTFLRKKLSDYDRNLLLRIMLKKSITTPPFPKNPDIFKNEEWSTNLLYLLNFRRTFISSDNMRFIPLKDKPCITNVNLWEIAKLIYDTDEYIFPDMFGSKDMVLYALPHLFTSGKDNMFCPKNLFVCEMNNEIVGIILWCKGRLHWDSTELEKLLVSLPHNFKAVKDEYIEGYAQTDDNTISILNLCVDSNHRGKHIATDMLKAFLDKYVSDGDTAKLCVLCTNKYAVKVYEKCGFIIDKTEQAYPRELQNHNRYVMQYRGNKHE